MRYLNAVEDAQGDLVDLEVYCSADCFREGAGEDPEGHAYPAPEKADYRQCCPRCETVTVAAIGEPSFDGWPENPDKWPED
jgi:hypothetical protein